MNSERKLRVDLLANLASFVVLGISGIAINLLIGRYYTPDTLGVFNQVFAFYILGAQFGAFGIHFSTLHYVARLQDRLEQRRCVTTALLLAILIATGIYGFGLAFTPWIGALLESPATGASLTLALPGIAFFTINKILIAVVNGRRQMVAFSVCQALRYLLILGFIVLCVVENRPGIELALAFTVSESLLMCVLLFLVFVGDRPLWDGLTPRWIKVHLGFGSKGFLSGAISELNTRVDILMLGLFLEDQLVGIYSMASMVAEGLAQLSVVVKNVVNPMITQKYAAAELVELSAFLRRIRIQFYGGFFIVGAVAIAAFPLFIEVITGSNSYEGAYLPFCILITSLVLVAGFLPMQMTLIQCGFPGYQTAQRAITVLVNILLNAMLIPLYGITGAAVATGGSYIISIAVLYGMCLRVAGFRL